MKDKYGDQDEEDRQMRMALTGSKKVQGFDLNKHQQFKKHGSLLAQKPAGQEIEEEEEGDDNDTAPTEAPTEPEAEAQDEEQKQEVVPTEEDEEESKQEEEEEEKQEGVNEA